MIPVACLNFPWPPSVNTYWRHPGGGKHLISAKGRSYRKEVGWEAKAQKCAYSEFGRLSVEIWAYPPDARRRDLDNLLKAILDALTGIAWKDDSQIDDLRIVRKGIYPKGLMEVKIEVIA